MASPSVLCKTHTTEDVILYCDDCELLVCRECVRQEHKLHNFLKFKEKVGDSRLCLTDNLLTLNSARLPRLRENLQDVISLQETKEHDTKDMLTEIVSRADKMIENITLIREKLMNRSELLHEKNLTVIEKKIAQINARIDIFERADAFAKGALEHGFDEEIIHEDLELRRQLHNFQPINIYEDIDRPIYVDGDLNELVLKQMFGTVLSEIRDLSNEDNKRPALKVQKISMFVCGNEDIVGICAIKSDVAWLHPKKGSRNTLVNVNGHQMSSLDFGFVVTSLTLSKNGKIYMTDYSINRIISMDSSKKFHTEITLSLHPIGIIVCSDEDILICLTDEWIYNTTSKSQRKVVRMTKEFKEKVTFELDEQGENIFTLPIAVAENLNGDVCVVDKIASDKGRVCVLYDTGKLRFVYEHRGASMPFDPSSVCCTRYSNIVIADPANNVVEIVSDGGEFLHFLITEKGGCIMPISLGKDPDDRIWIGCGSGKCIILKYRYGLPK
ncbi:tripartite motif-containing protein 2-like [Mytilus californianus]|uniref:tripartite motif-containing protein 2-like n=1 Tax=Mytilus californianus TaxID=6549 RepID=UPI0022460A5B|nr:tripartite motif-containing protein 2-like [Mytilus californianus]